MKLLFDIDRTHAEELHEVLGFIDADFGLAPLLPYLRKTTREVIKWIGEKNYQIAIEQKKEDSNDEYVQLLRFCIAMGTWRHYAPLSDVSHTTSGRTFRSDEHMKAAWEWQIDKSDENLEKSFYSALDEIITFILDAVISEDKTTYSFELPVKLSKIKNLAVNSLDIFQDSVKINDSYLLFLNLIPSLEMAEKQLVKPRVGDKFEDYLKNEDSAVRDIIRAICVYFAMADGIKKHSVQLFPRSVFQESKNGKFAARRLDIEATVLFYKDENKILLRELEKLVAKDKNKVVPVNVINFDKDDSFVTM